MKFGLEAVILLAVAAAVVSAVAGQGLTPGECAQEKSNIRRTCLTVAFGQKPSTACCQLIRAAHVDCVCRYVNPKLMAAIGGVRRAVRLIRGCGRPVPSHFRCGSVTTP